MLRLSFGLWMLPLAYGFSQDECDASQHHVYKAGSTKTVRGANNANLGERWKCECDDGFKSNNPSSSTCNRYLISISTPDYCAEGNEDGLVCVEQVAGCTDETACNYNQSAELDDGTCENVSCDNTCCSGNPFDHSYISKEDVFTNVFFEGQPAHQNGGDFELEHACFEGNHFCGTYDCPDGPKVVYTVGGQASVGDLGFVTATIPVDGVDATVYIKLQDNGVECARHSGAFSDDMLEWDTCTTRGTFVEPAQCPTVSSRGSRLSPWFL